MDMSRQRSNQQASGTRISRIIGTAGTRLLAGATVLATAAGVVLLGAPLSAQADDHHDHARFSWDQRVVTVKSTVPSAWGVNTAVRRWNERRVSGQPRLVVRNHISNPDIRIRTVHAPAQWWTGLSSGSADGATLTTMTIKLNTATIGKPELKYDGSFRAAKYWTTSHELGHALGLEHRQNVTRSVMSYSNPWWQTEGRPSGYDFRQLGRLY